VLHGDVCLFFVCFVLRTSASKAGVIAGATVGALVGFAFLVAILFFLWKRNRDNEDEMANDIK